MSCEYSQEIWPFDDEVSSVRITINKDEEKSTATAVCAVRNAWAILHEKF